LNDYSISDSRSVSVGAERYRSVNNMGNKNDTKEKRVVRCGECIYWKEGKCLRIGTKTKKDWYCGAGEKVV